MPLLNGTSAEWPEDVFVQISEAQTGRAVRTKRWKYGVDAPGESGLSSDTYVEQYLYDLQADPYELNNLVGHQSHAGVAEVMSQRLVRRMREAGEDEPKIEHAEVRGSGQRTVSEKERYA